MWQFEIKGIWQRFTANWGKRNWVTDVFLYGAQVAAVLFLLETLAGILGVIHDFCNPHSLMRYQVTTIDGLIFRMHSKGLLVGLALCIVVFFCNRRVIRWKIDGILWMFIVFFVISIFTLAVENEMFLYFSVFSMGSLAIYFLSLFLPKKIGETNTTTFQQCSKPTNWLITLSFIVMLLWSILLCDVICHF